MRKTLLIFPFTLFLVSCKKDHSTLTADVQPAADALNAAFSDTARVLAHTVAYDSVASYNDRYKYLGSWQDPVFGRTDASIYANFSIKNGLTNLSFGNDPNLTSAEIVLVLADQGAASQCTTDLTYSVFALDQSLDENKLYYTNTKGMYNKNALLASCTGSVSLLENKWVLRIPVDANYASAILLNTQYLVDNATMQSTYKGFFITTSGSNVNPVNNQGYLVKCDLDDALSGFYLYYQNGPPSPVKEYLSCQFVFNGSDAVRFNAVNYHLGSIPSMNLADQVLNKDTSRGSVNLFLKGLGGTKVKVHIPGLKNYADSFAVSVNRAEVVFHLDPAFTAVNPIYSYPPRYALIPVSETGQEAYALDQLTDGDLARYGGTYDASLNRIVFNLGKEVQAILRGTRPNRGFWLVVADPAPLYTPRRDSYHQRIVLAGSSNASYRPTFNFSFIKLRHD